MSSATIKLQGGGSLESIVIDVDAGLPTQGDLLYAAQIQRSVILARTEHGLDVNGRAFAPYNTTRPFYFYPAGSSGLKRSSEQAKRDRSSVKRFARKLGRTKNAISSSGFGIRFQSYDAFKRTYLGRSNVDLRGAKAPHMLQEIVCRSGSNEVGEKDQRIGLEDMPEEGSEFTLGIYGSAAERASGINSDDRPKGMPKREFFGSSKDDNERLTNIITRRIADRVMKRFREQ